MKHSPCVEKYTQLSTLPSIGSCFLFVLYNLGFTVEAELGDDAEREDQLCVFISEIEKGGLAYHQGKLLFSSSADFFLFFKENFFFFPLYKI